MNPTNNQPLCTAADRLSYALTAEQVAIAIAGHDLRTYKGWMAAAEALLADAPYMTAIREGETKQMVLKIEWEGKPAIVSYYDHHNGVYSEQEMADYDSSAWNETSWDGVSEEENAATLTIPVFVTLRHE